MADILQRYADRILGVLSCYDRVIIHGRIPEIAYAKEGQVSRMLKRLWMHDLIRKVGRTYKYYITERGRTVITMGLKLKELVLIPELARALA